MLNLHAESDRRPIVSGTLIIISYPTQVMELDAVDATASVRPWRAALEDGWGKWRRKKYTNKQKTTMKGILFYAVMKCRISRDVSNHPQTITTPRALCSPGSCTHALPLRTTPPRNHLTHSPPPAPDRAAQGRITAESQVMERRNEEERDAREDELIEGESGGGGGGPPSLHPPRPDKRGRRRK